MKTYTEYLSGKVNFTDYFSQFSSEELVNKIADEIKQGYSEYLGGAYIPKNLILPWEKLGEFVSKSDMPSHERGNVAKVICRSVYENEHLKAKKLRSNTHD